MKLKKIASLMLAGIMAVSMLAGCKTGTTTDDEKNPVVPVASNAVEYAKNALSADMKDNVNVVASTELDGWVKNIATDSSKLSADNIEVANSKYVIDYNTGADKTMSAALIKKLQEKGVVVSNNFTTMPNGTFSQSYGWMYAVSGKMDEKSAVEAAVKFVEDWAKTKCEETVKSGSDIYNCDYTAEISTLKVTNDSLTNESAWTVAIVITQKLAKAANVEA